MDAAIPNPAQELDEVAWARELVTRIVRECPRRVATGPDERRAHALIAEEMSALGLATELHRFRWNDSVYATLALHFGLGAVGSLLGPWLGLLLHAGTAASYALDSSRKAFVLRRLSRFGESQNVLGTLAARKPLRRRVVFHAHADAAFTGIMFRPEVAGASAKSGSPLYKSLRIATGALAGLAALDLLQLVAGKWRLLSLARMALTVPPLAAFALNLDVVLRRQTVPGAMDDLSGIAGLLLLARRLSGRVPEDVEVVFVATGAEEAGLGGSQALARDKRKAWNPDQTVVIGLDGLANGELRYFVEGEIFPLRLAPWLRKAVVEVATSEPRFAEVCAHEIPAGGTDSVPFAAAGYDAVTLGTVDPKLGMPREYHLPSDTPDNLEVEKIPYCVDFAERLFERVVA
jgi:hypothetical protein